MPMGNEFAGIKWKDIYGMAFSGIERMDFMMDSFMKRWMAHLLGLVTTEFHDG